MIGKPSKLPPREPCFVLFKGFRKSRSGLYELLKEPLEVLEWQDGKSKVLVVAMCGRAKKYPIATFEGEWTKLQLEEGQ